MKTLCSHLIFIGFIFLTLPTNGQNLSFHKLYCTTDENYAIKDYELMQTGSIFIVGVDTNDYINTQGSAVLKKYDKDFNMIWEKKFGGSGMDLFNLIRYIGDNRFLVRGNTTSQDGDVLNNYPSGNNEWVCIIDTNGNILHQLIYGGSSSTTSMSIKLSPKGMFYFCGSTFGTNYDFIDNGPFDFQNDGYIACADSQLNKKWLKFYKVVNGNSAIRDVEFLPSGNLLMIAATNVKDGAFAVNTPTPTGASVVMETDTSGNVLWQKRYGAADPNPNYLSGTIGKIYKDTGKWEYYISAFTPYKTADCWDSYPYLAKGDHDYHWVMKIDTLGNKIWSHIYGGFSDDGLDELAAFSEIFSENILHFPDAIEGSDQYAFGNAIGKTDTWLVYIDSNGVMYKHNRVGFPNVFWQPIMVKKNPLTNEMYYLYRDGKSATYVPSPYICDSTVNVANYIIGKYNFWANSINESKVEDMVLTVYPNPAKDEIYIEQLNNGTLIEIFDAVGKRLLKFNSVSPKETISVAGWPRGSYIVKASYKKYRFSQKVILQ